MSLASIQADITAAIFADEEIDAIHPREHLVIYRNNIFTALTRALSQCYPLIQMLVGDEYFHYLAQDYIERYPSRSSNIHEYGEYFSDFLHEYVLENKLNYLPDVARFEWSCHQVYFAAEHSGFDITQLQNIVAEQFDSLHLSLHPASRLMAFDYAIPRIINACDSKATDLIDIGENGCYLLVIRRESEITFSELSMADYTFLHAIEENKSVSDALTETLNIDAFFKLEDKLPKWIQDKVIVGCEVV